MCPRPASQLGISRFTSSPSSETTFRRVQDRRSAVARTRRGSSGLLQWARLAARAEATMTAVPPERWSPSVPGVVVPGDGPCSCPRSRLRIAANASWFVAHVRHAPVDPKRSKPAPLVPLGVFCAAAPPAVVGEPSRRRPARSSSWLDQVPVCRRFVPIADCQRPPVARPPQSP